MNPSSFGCCYDRSLCRRNTSDGVLIHPLFFGHGQGLFYCRSSFAGFYLSVYCSFFFLLSVFLLSVYLAIKFSYVGQVKHVRTRVSRRNELLQSAIVFFVIPETVEGRAPARVNVKTVTGVDSPAEV